MSDTGVMRHDLRTTRAADLPLRLQLRRISALSTVATGGVPGY